jgi:nitric oxide reductase activation protein
LVLLVTDGDPHDVDVHDSRYLLADLRQAVRDSLRHEVGVACVNLGASRSAGQPAGALRGAFAPGAYREVGSLAEFPQVVVRALHCALESAPRR